MRACLNCNHKNKRINIATYYQCIGTQTFRCWCRNVLHNIIVVSLEVILLMVFVASALCVISSPNHPTWSSCLLHALFGGIILGLSLLGMAYLSEREERRKLKNDCECN